MATPNLADIDPQAFFDAQREKWQKQAEDARTKLAEAEGWLAKFDAFEGKIPAPDFLRESPKRKGPAPGTPRAPRGSGDSAKAKVLELVNQHPEGISSKDITAALPDMKSLPNLLSMLKKSGDIQQEGRGNPYFPKAA